MTGGGPANSTLLYAVNLYNRAFHDVRHGLCLGAGLIMFCSSSPSPCSSSSS